MARAFNVSLRTLRFYEDKGLIAPRREGTTRYYTPSDKGKLELILQGKQLGFTLIEIRDMLAQSDHTSSGRGRLTLQPDQISAQLAHLERQRSDIDGAILELKLAQSLMQYSR